MFLFVLVTFAAYRATRLVTKDDFPPVAKIRAWFVGADERKLVGTRWEWFGDLITCYWCAGFWVAGLSVLVADAFTSVPLPWLYWFAVAGASSLLAHVEGYLSTSGLLPVESSPGITWNSAPLTSSGTVTQYTSSG